MHQAIPSDQHARRSNRGEQNPEHPQLDRVLSETRRLAHGLDHPVNNGCALIVGMAGIGAVDLGADEVEGEEFEGAIEGGLDDLAVGGVEGENEGLEDGLGVGIGEAVERGGEVWIGGIGNGFELVERGFAGGDEARMLPPRGVFDDLVERRP